MARPKQLHPTPAELEVLQVLWDDGPATVRQVMERLHQQRPRSYTTVMTLLNVMHEKGFLRRKADGRAFIYTAKADRAKTLGGMVGDLLRRAFQGSSSTLLSHLLDHSPPNRDELDAIRSIIEEHERESGDAS